MIVTEIYEGQGLGNQLWVYAASRSIAEQLGIPFVLLGADRFKGNGFLNIATEVGVSAPEACEVAMRGAWRGFHETLFYDRDLEYLASGFDNRVLELQGLYKLDGLFQSEQYFFGDLERPARYVALEERWKEKNLVPEDTCVINLRGGEYKRYKNFILPLKYWTDAIKNMRKMGDVRQFLVVTDDRRYARAMFPEFEVLDGGVGDCYASLYNARYLILSNSTFSYFPVKTGGNSRIVIAPRHWARYGNPHGYWASPANLYESWLWQSADGRLATFEECRSECMAIESEYYAKYFVRTTMDQVQKPGIRRFVPLAVRRGAKQVLSILFPKHFG